MMFQTKPAIKSLGVTGPVIAILVIALGAFGINISGDVAGLPEKIAELIDGAIAIAAIAAGVWGRVRATTEIKGVFKGE